MKVLRIFHGGVVERYQRRDRELTRLGHSVTLIVPVKYRELPHVSFAREVSESLFSVLSCPTYGPLRNPLWAYSVSRLKDVFAQVRPDVVDLHEEPYSLAAASVLHSLPANTPLIFRSSQNVYKKYPLPFSAIQRAVFDRSSAAYVPSNQASDVLRGKGYTLPVTVIGNGIEYDAALELPAANPSERLSVAYAGRYTQRKGFEDLLEAASRLPDIDFHIAGGKTPPGLSAPENVYMNGSLDFPQLIAMFRQCEVIVVPSRVMSGWSEQFCRSLVEGMANYLMPVVSTSGALTDVGGPEAVVFSANSVSSLSAALSRVAEMPKAERVRRRIAAHERAGSYAWSSTSIALEKIYKDTLELHHGHPS